MLRLTNSNCCAGPPDATLSHVEPAPKQSQARCACSEALGATVKLGLVAAAAAAAGDEHKPQDTNLVGTPHYMSPELLSCKAYGFKTDVWWVLTNPSPIKRQQLQQGACTTSYAFRTAARRMHAAVSC
jgi:serine/threonine protein kinase